MSIYDTIPKSTLPEGTVGDWSIQKFTITKDDERLEQLRAAFSMDSYARRPYAGDYTRLVCEGRGVIMSDTRAEIIDHLDFVRNATGNVLIMGLGLGLCLQAVLNKPDVTGVTVIELEPDVIKLTGQHFKDRRVRIIQANALEWKPAPGDTFDAAWFDIWDSICEDNNEDMKLLHRRFGRKAAWKGSWGRPEIIRMQRESRRSWW